MCYLQQTHFESWYVKSKKDGKGHAMQILITRNPEPHWFLQGRPFFFFCSTGDWTQDLILARLALYHLSHASSPLCFSFGGFFWQCWGLISGLWLARKVLTAWATLAILFALVIFETVLVFCWGWPGPRPSYFMLLGWQAWTAMSSHWLRWGSVWWTFCLGLPQTAILLISSSQVARILGMSHHVQLYKVGFKIRYSLRSQEEVL
jgi:hypothetical protein